MLAALLFKFMERKHILFLLGGVAVALISAYLISKFNLGGGGGGGTTVVVYPTSPASTSPTGGFIPGRVSDQVNYN